MKKIINITGGCRGCGATFTAVTTALFMARSSDRVTYMEDFSASIKNPNLLDEAAVFYDLSLDKHINKSRFADFDLLKETGKRTDNRVNLYSNVNWVVKLPGSLSCSSIAPDEVAGRYILWDSPSLFLNGRSLLQHGENKACSINKGTSPNFTLKPNLILCVIDPLPGKVMASAEHVNFLKENFSEVTLWIFNNGSNEDIKHAEKFLRIKADFCIPMENRRIFYEAQKRHTHPAAFDASVRQKAYFKDETIKVFEELARYILTLY